MNRIQILSLATLLALGLPAPAQTGPAPQANATPPPAPPRPPESDPDPATLKAMKSRIFEIKHRSPFALANSLRVLASGVRGARLELNDRDGLNTIAVRDFPENIAAIEEAIKRLDMPSAIQKTSDVELTLHVLFASKTALPNAELPADLQEVVKQLKGTLAYRGYALAASLTQRVGVNGDRTIQGRGELDGGALASSGASDSSQLFLDWESDRGVALEPGEEGTSPRYVLRKFQFWLRERGGSAAASETLARLETGITLKDGERVVVGTSVVKGQGLIVVLSARRVD